MSTNAKKPRRAAGRPREFHEETALDGALKAFWTKGYAGTTLDELTTAMDLNRPSVYGAFGNKEALYTAAVNRYVASIGAGYFVPLSGTDPLADELDAFYAAVIDVVTGGHGPLGCIVACTLPAEAGASDGARELLAGVLKQIDDALKRRFESAKKAGEIPASSDARVLAQVITSGMLAVSIRARSGESRRELKRLARTFVDLVAGR